MDLVRPLGLAGIRCAVVAKPGDPIRYSRFTAEVLDWMDPWKQPEELVERLVSWGQGQAAKPVLFYEEDRDLLLISRHRERLAPAFHFVVPEAGLVEDLVDKARFQRLAERVGLPVPRTQRLSPGQGTSLADVELSFPLIIKPLTRRTDLWVPIARDNKALQVASPAELAELWPKLESAQLEVLAQELIPGPETQIESYHCYRDRRGEIAGEFTGKKIRTYPAEFGYSTALEITASEDVTLLGRELARRLDLRGIAKFDFKRSPDGELYLLEINARFNLWHHPAAIAGVNLPALVYADLTGQPRPPSVQARAGVQWCYLWYDAAAAKEWGVPISRWLPWALSCPAKSAVSLDDPMPFLRGVLWRKLSGITTSAAKRG
jgi:D-aspartate ligase